jgi:hypothetical protein
MKKQYYIRYYQTDDNCQTFEQFLQSIASTGVRLHTVSQRDFDRIEYNRHLSISEKRTYTEYTTIWEIDERADYVLLENKINQAILASTNLIKNKKKLGI